MSTPEYVKARRHLSRRDPVLREIVRRTGPCTLVPNADHFGVLARSIVAQQISTKAAEAISGRLVAALGRRGLKPKPVLDLAADAMKAAGLSANKQRALRELAERCVSGAIPLKKLGAMDDEAVIESLIPVFGIGRWTAEMFLIFSLGRLDVLPTADFGLRNGVKLHYGLDDLPGKRDLEARGEPWRPYRSVATWYFWRGFGAVPQST